MFGTLPYRLVRTIRMPKHQLSHQTLHAAYHRLALDAWPSAAGGWTLVPYEQLEDYAIRACSTAISSGSATAIADPCAIPISVFSYGLPYESESPRL